MRNILLVSFLCCVTLVEGYGQRLKVSGRVASSDDGSNLPGTTVFIKGSNEGTITDAEGRYSLTANANDLLVFSFVGYLSKEVAVQGRAAIDVTLDADIEQLSEVVVTAFGIERESNKIGYATTTLGGDEVAEAKQINFMQSLAGKVAGVNITAPPTGPAGSTNIQIRGIRSLTDDNRPLIIVDGVPIDNQIFEPAGKWGGRDGGDGLTSINPDDIESVTVLKGASSITLYGTNAQNGAIVITTKRGQARKGIGVELNSNYVFEDIALFPDFQTEYGQGIDGVAPTSIEQARTLGSWGERFNGQNVIAFDGVERPYRSIERKKNLRNYYETGYTFTNTIAMTGGTENANGRLSIANVDNQGIVPNTTYDRISINAITNLKLGKKLSAEVKANYVREEALNRPNLSDNPSNPGKSLNTMPSNIDVDWLRQNVRDENGSPVQAFASPFTLNPFWGPFENINNDNRERLIGYATLRYNFTDWLTLQGRVSLDQYTQRIDNLEEIGTAHNVNGAVTNDIRQVKTENYDLFLLGTKSFNKRFSLDYTIGMTRFDTEQEFFRAQGNRLVILDNPNITNSRERNPAEYRFVGERKNAIFGTTTFGYQGFLFLEGALRKEWLSSLTNPVDLEGSNNSITFGSVSASLIFSDAFTLPSFINFGKFRVSYGTAGGGTRPYQAAITYNLEGNNLGTASLANIGTNVFPNPNIRPNFTVSREIGLAMDFLNNRLGFDFTFYQTNTTDQLLQAQLPRSSGYENALINAGEVENKGIELLISGVPINIGAFAWETSINFSRNRAEVLSLSDGDDFIQIDDSRFAGIGVQHRVGSMPSMLVGNKVARDDQGNIIHDASGLPMPSSEIEELGNFAPDYIFGFTNTFSYKNFSLNILIDGKLGAEIASLTKTFALARGLDKATLVGRENPDFTIVGEGVNEEGEANVVPAQLNDYYTSLGLISETTILDASYIKLREVRLNYRLPGKWFKSLPVQSATFGVVGRNLFFFRNDLAALGIDPEGLYNNSNAAGLEFASLPSTRSFGFNLNVKF